MSHIGHALTLLPAIRGNRPFAIYSSKVTTGNEFLQRVATLANGLQQLGLKNGEVVAIAALNSDLYLEWLFAVICAGGIIAPLNHRWSSEEAGYAAGIVNAVMIVLDSHTLGWSSQFAIRLKDLRYQVFIGSRSELKHTHLICTEYIRELAQGCNALKFHWAPDFTAIICFTSGTTGRPKGAALSHNALIVQSLAKIAVLGYNCSDVYLHTTPFCHIGGISSALAFVYAGACNIFLPKFQADAGISSALAFVYASACNIFLPKVQADAVVDAIHKYSVSSTIFVPTMLSDIVAYCRQMSNAAGTQLLFASMRKILNGGGTLSQQLLQNVIKIFPTAKLFSAYGMTETSSLTFITLYDPALKEVSLVLRDERNSRHKNAGVCVGQVAPHVEIQIEEDHQISYDGKLYTVGKILTKGPHVMHKYWNQQQALKAFNKSGWFITNDIGWIDDQGQLWFLGRSKDMIKSGGENIFPLEVEEVLMKHPGIKCAVVFGTPDSRYNEIVTASIQVKNDWRWIEDSSMISSNNIKFVSPRHLQLFCKEHGLSGFKVPKRFCLHRGFYPRTSTGKVRRDAVKAQFVNILQEKARSSL